MAIKGFLEGLTPSGVWGWAMDSDDPQEVLRVELCRGEAVLARAEAGKRHVGLLANGIGTGNHAFNFRLDPELSKEELAALSVRAISRGAGAATLPRYVPQTPVVAPPRLQADWSVAPDTEESTPVFVLGCPRSGTSVVSLALWTRTRYQGFRDEGHIIDLLDPLYRVIERFYAEKGPLLSNPNLQLMIREVPRSYFEDGIGRLFKDMAARLAPGQYWFDKTPTPEMVRAAPIAAKLWPQAKFIFMRRRGFENLASALRKFPGTPFQELCQRWVDCMLSWQSVRPLLAGRAIELDQHFVARQPAAAAAAIAGLIGLDGGEQRRVSEAFSLVRPERTAPVADQVYEAMPAEWTAEQQGIFNRICRPFFEQFGYAEDARYYLDGDERGWRRL